MATWRPKYVAQRESWDCAIASSASLLGLGYSEAFARAESRFSRGALLDGLDGSQVRRVLAPHLVLGRLRDTVDWDILRRAMTVRRDAIAALVGIGWNSRRRVFHFGVFVMDSNGGYFMDPRSARHRPVGHARDGGRRRDLPRLGLSHFHLVLRP